MKLYRSTVVTIMVRVVDGFVLMDMERQGYSQYVLCEFEIHCICVQEVSVGPLEVSSSIVDMDSYYHREACLGCHRVQTALTND